MVRKINAVMCASLMASSAFGHEGHGVPGQGNTVSHYAFAPLHLPLLLGLCLLVFGFAMVAKKYLKSI